MKKIYLFLLFAFSSQFIQAQNDEFMNTLSQKACECITEKSKEDKTLRVEELLETCMMQTITENVMEFMEHYGDMLGDENKAQEFGVAFGMKLMKDCPVLASAAINSGLDNKKTLNTTPKNPQSKGSFSKLAQSGYSYILANVDGKEEKFFIVEKFKGSDNIFGKEKTLKNKNMTFEWEEREVYFAKSKSFEKVKVLLAINIAE